MSMLSAHTNARIHIYLNFFSIEFQNLAIVDIQSEPSDLLENLKLQYANTQIVYFKCDISVKDEIETTFNTIESLFQSIDILINAAGIFNDKNIELTFKVNVVSQ